MLHCVGVVACRGGSSPLAFEADEVKLINSYLNLKRRISICPPTSSVWTLMLSAVETRPLWRSIGLRALQGGGGCVWLRNRAASVTLLIVFAMILLFVCGSIQKGTVSDLHRRWAPEQQPLSTNIAMVSRPRGMPSNVDTESEEWVPLGKTPQVFSTAIDHGGGLELTVEMDTVRYGPPSAPYATTQCINDAHEHM